MLEDISDTVHEIDEQLDEVIGMARRPPEAPRPPGQDPPQVTPRKTCCVPPFRAKMAGTTHTAFSANGGTPWGDSNARHAV